MKAGREKYFGFLFFCLTALAAVFCLAACGKKTVSDGKRFKAEYEEYNNVTREDGITLWPVEIPEDNPFVYVTPKEAASLAESGTGVLFIGSAWCRVCRMDAVLLLAALQDERADGNEYVKHIYYLDPDTVEPEDDSYGELSEKVLSRLHGYIGEADQPQTNVYGTPKMIDRKKSMDEADAGNLEKYKYTISFWYEGKLLGMNVGSTSHFVDSDTPPDAEDIAEFAKRFWELADLLGEDLCDYCNRRNTSAGAV